MLKINIITLFLLFQGALSLLDMAYGSQLSQEQKGVLRVAMEEGDYPIIFLEKEIEGIPRNVLLVGETHIVDQKRHEIGTRLIDHFPLIGIEGLDFSKMPESAQADLRFYYFFGRLFRSGTGSYNGPARTAAIRDKESYLEKTDKDQCMLFWLRDYESDPYDFLSQFEFDENSKITKSWMKENYPRYARATFIEDLPEDEVLTPERVTALILQMRERHLQSSCFDLVPLEALDPVPPGFVKYAENLRRSEPALKILFSSVGGFFVSGALHYFVPNFFTKSALIGTAVGALGSASYVAGFFNPILPDEYAIDLSKKGMDDRNHVMSKNIVKALFIRPKEQIMLVFVGRNHLAQMNEILLQYGFRSSAFP